VRRRTDKRILATDLIVHPEYVPEHDQDNDIALVRLQRPPRAGIKTSIIRLAADPNDYSDLIRRVRGARVIGWGRASSSLADSLAPKLQVLKTRVASDEYCAFRHFLWIWNGAAQNLAWMGASDQTISAASLLASRLGARALPTGAFCAATYLDPFGNPLDGDIFFLNDPKLMLGELKYSISNEPTPCQGDSGGPLFTIEPDNTFLQIGVVSYGQGNRDQFCGLTIAPPVYTNVGAYGAWIQSIIGGPRVAAPVVRRRAEIDDDDLNLCGQTEIPDTADPNRAGKAADIVAACGRVIASGNLPPTIMAILLARRGQIYFLTNNDNAALADFDRALEFDPEAQGVYHMRGLLHISANRANRALLDLSEAIRLEPELYVAYLNRSSVYVDLGQRARARADIDAAADIMSHRPRAAQQYYDAFRYADRARDYSAAVEFLEKTLDSYDDATAFRNAAIDGGKLTLWVRERARSRGSKRHGRWPCLEAGNHFD